MARAGHDPDLIERNVVPAVDVLGHRDQIVGNDAFDRRDDEFIAERFGQGFERRFQVNGRSCQHDDLRIARHLVETVRQVQAPRIETDVPQVARVGPVLTHMLQDIPVADVPADVPFVFEKYLDQSRSPTAVTDHRTPRVPIDVVRHDFIRFQTTNLQII